MDNMEKAAVVHSRGETEEANPESFICCVCLDLLYKPIVLACGHIACFWCVHKSMNCQRDSNCPICRHPYNHFPTICQMLHFLLLKLYPDEYRRRGEQILEEEKKNGVFSPQFDDNACDHLMGLEHPSGLGSNSCSNSSSFRIEAHCANQGKTEFISGIQNDKMSIPNETPPGNCSTIKTMSVEETELLENKRCGKCEHVSIADVLCSACKQLLFHPVVLNCGHVYCESCVTGPVDKILRCEVCQCLHPKGLPKVCLEFDQFLLQKFPEECALRRDTVQPKQAQAEISCPTAYSTGDSKEGSQGDHLPWWVDPQSKFHIGVGCDSCGVYPIIGDRYKCMDCVEDIGFDLCGDCYNTRSKLPGRFNQQHKPDHRFQLVQSTTIRDIMLSLVNRRLENGSPASNYNGALEISASVFPGVDVSADDQESDESIPSMPTAEHEDETQSSP